MYEHRHRRSIPRLRGILRLGRGPRKGRGRGQALVEFALALPILIVLVAGVLEMGRGYSFSVATSDAARDAARHVAGKTATTNGPGLAAMCSLDTADHAAMTINVSCPTLYNNTSPLYATT